MNVSLVREAKVAPRQTMLVEAMLLASVADAVVFAAWWGVEQLVGLAQWACGVFLVMYGLLFTSVS